MVAPRVTAVSSPSSTTVLVTFDQAMSVDAVLLDPLSYAIDGGLRVRGVTEGPTPGTQVTLTTSGQQDDRSYRLSVSAGVLNAALENLDPAHSALPFTGTGGVSDYVVTGLTARPGVIGLRTVELYWTNPAGVTNCKIVRRQRNWIFEDGDAGDVVYDGVELTPASEGEPNFTDTGLLPQTFYYYVVMVKADPGDEYVVTEESRVVCAALKSAAVRNTTGFMRKAIPATHWKKDRETPQNGFLEKHTTAMARVFDVVRGEIDLLRLLGDDQNGHYDYVKLKSRMVGFEPEGEGYDFGTPRRVFLKLAELWRTKGTVPALVTAVWALTLWDVELVEFGGGSAHTRSFSTYDPEATSDPATANTFNTTGSGGFLTLTDGTKTWATDAWANGRVVDGLGNWADVETNTATLLTLRTPPAEGPWRSRLGVTDLLGGGFASSAYLITGEGLLVGQRVWITDNRDTGGSFRQLLEIDQIQHFFGTTLIDYWQRLTGAVTQTDGGVFWDCIEPAKQIDGIAPGGEPAGTLTPTVSGGGVLKWQTDQWVGFRLKRGVSTYTVTANTATSLTFSPAAVLPAGAFILARTLDGGDNSQLNYQVFQGEWHFLFDPTWDAELRGTRLDPFSYLYSGSAALLGAFGPCDVGLYVTTDDATEAVGRTTGVSGAVLTDSSAVFTPGAFRGMYLLPNQNQERLFEIEDNTGTTITVRGGLDEVAVVDQAYAVLTARNATRYQRLLKRLPELTHQGVRPRVLFL